MNDHLKIYGAGIIIIISGFLLANHYVKPAPPKKISIATGSEYGAYYAFAKRYQALLKKSGITLSIVKTGGSLENIQHLVNQDVDIAFIQSGTGQKYMQSDSEALDLVSLGSIYLEPLWLFLPKHTTINNVLDLRGKRIAVGGKGSGTQVLAKLLLGENGIDADNSGLLELSMDQANEGLLSGKVDAMFAVAALEAPVIQKLLVDPNIVVFDFDRAKAYTRRYPFLSNVELPQGVVDLSQNIPNQDIQLLSAAATLVAQNDMHPAIVTLLMQIAAQVHGPGGVLEEAGQFPSEKFVDFTLDADAKRYFDYGPPLLQRFLPFWAAVLVNQLKVFLIPLIALLIPLMRFLPPLYRWRVRSRIYRWYKNLRQLETKLANAESQDQRNELIKLLDQLEWDVAEQTAPLSYSEELYHLRSHIHMVKVKYINL